MIDRSVMNGTYHLVNRQPSPSCCCCLDYDLCSIGPHRPRELVIATCSCVFHDRRVLCGYHYYDDYHHDDVPAVDSYDCSHHSRSQYIHGSVSYRGKNDDPHHHHPGSRYHRVHRSRRLQGSTDRTCRPNGIRYLLSHDSSVRPPRPVPNSTAARPGGPRRLVRRGATVR
jgi:hypothetical protein